MSSLDLILTYDIGTTACKSMLFGVDGTVVAMAEQEFPTRHPKPMWAEQDPDDWWTAVVSTTRSLMEGRENSRILGIGLSSQRETIVPVDRQGNKLEDAILWMDRRTAKEAEDLASHFGRENLHRVTGMIPDATFSATKLLWLKRHRPEIIDVAYCFLQPKEYVCLKLTGEFTTDYSLASRTMMLDTRKLCWCDDVFDMIGLPKQKMPQIYYSDEVVGTVTKDAAELLGIPSGIPVVAGGGDRQCEAVGAGIFGDRAMESTGTTSNISCASDHVIDDLDIRVVCSVHALRGHWLIEQGLTTSGSILRWFRDTFCHQEQTEAAVRGTSTYAIIDEMVADAQPGSQKLLMLPFFMGAKATRWNPAARGAFLGVTLGHSRAEFARAIMEGVAFELRACLDILKGIGLDPSHIVSMGGGSRGDVWNQIRADVTGRPVTVPRVTDAASLGAMILAAKGAGVLDDVSEASVTLNAPQKRYIPTPSSQAVYDQLYPIYNSFYAAVEDLFDRLETVEAQ